MDERWHEQRGAKKKNGKIILNANKMLRANNERTRALTQRHAAITDDLNLPWMAD